MMGVAARLECRGPRPWEEARAWLRTLAEMATTLEGAAGDPPLAFVGFSFDGRPAPEWDLPAGVVLIPALEWRRNADGRGTITSWRLAESEEAPLATGERRRDEVAPEPASAKIEDDWSREGWSQAVGRVLEEIRSGRVEKVVLARSRASRMPLPLDAAAAFAALRDAHPSCFRFLYWDERGGLVLGASPERLVSLREGLVRADAVAGTAPVREGDGAEASRDLLSNRKELREHTVVVRDLLSKLGSICDRVTASDGPSLQLLRHVAHLKTSVTGSAPPGTHVLDLVSRLHPTPAVAGSPPEAALTLIRALEPRSRGWYAGPIGWVDAAGDGDFAVGIRSAHVRGDRALLYAGAGIVEGSVAEREWEECAIKMRFIEDALLRG